MESPPRTSQSESPSLPEYVIKESKLEPFGRSPSRLRDKADVEAWVEHLDELGVRHSPVIEATIGWILRFHDPDGLELGLYTAAAHDKATASFSK